jgi:para-nitrobenzyl esterase
MILTRRAFIATGLAASATAGFSAQEMTPVVKTTNGPVRGQSDGVTHVFKGIRYGADTRQTRFQPPKRPAPWKAPIDAFAYGAASPQSGRETEAMSEDCLFLNVWTRGLNDGAKRPVMVYIHGGAYSHGSGSSPLYDGARLTRRGDVVVVTLNHRLACFGYLYLDQLASSGNAGTLDLVLALEWVRDNIAAFGGDPNRVMLFGQSGGGAKIATLMATPAAKALFHAAATMSGQQVTASGPMNAAKRTKAFLAALNADPMTATTDQLVTAMKATDPVIGAGGLYFGPVFDNVVLDRHPFYPDAPAMSAAIPMMIGNTHDETRLLIGSGDPKTFELTWEQLPARLGPEMRVDIRPELVIAKYRELYPNYSPSDVFFSATTAGRSWRAAIIEAELRAQQGSPAYVYQVDWPSPIDGGKWRAPHTIDIALAFDNVAAPGALAGNSPESQHMADLMSEAFIAFARTGSPQTAALPQWTPYGLPERQTMIFDSAPRMENDPRGAERRLFAQVPFVQQGT